MKKFEIEQKYRCSNHAAMRKLIKKLGGKPLRSGSEINELWDRGGELAGKKTILRLRRHGRSSELTVKGPKLKSEFTRRVELETHVEYAPAKAILTALGYRISKKYSKRRETFKLGRLIVTLDKLPRFGAFAELEGAAADIRKTAAKLGLKDEDREERSYLEMIYGWRD